jgi:hypothetical protein
LATLAVSRRFLKYSYVAAWACRDNAEQREKLEDLQTAIGCMTERLSRITSDTEVDSLDWDDECSVINLLRVISFYTASINEMTLNHSL